MAELAGTSLFSDANLQAYYKLENLNDSKGSNNLTDHNTVAFNSGKYSLAADAGASNSSKYLDVASALGYNNGAYSIAFWVKLQTEITSGSYCFVTVSDASTNTNLTVDYLYNSGTPQIEAFHLRNLVGSENATYNYTLGTSNWHHLALVNNTTNVLLYLDGSQVASVAFNSGTGSSGLTTTMKVFTDRVASGNYASALIDDLGFFNRALTPAEITTLYNDVGGGAFLLNFV